MATFRQCLCVRRFFERPRENESPRGLAQNVALFGRDDAIDQVVNCQEQQDGDDDEAPPRNLHPHHKDHTFEHTVEDVAKNEGGDERGQLVAKRWSHSLIVLTIDDVVWISV